MNCLLSFRYLLSQRKSEQKTQRRDGESGETLNVLLFIEAYKQVYDKIETLAFCTRFYPGCSSWPHIPASIPPPPPTAHEPPPQLWYLFLIFCCILPCSTSGVLSSPATPPKAMPGSFLSFLSLDNYIFKTFSAFGSC